MKILTKDKGMKIFAKFLKEIAGVEMKDGEEYFYVGFNKGNEVWGIYGERKEMHKETKKYLNNMCEDAIEKYDKQTTTKNNE